MLRHDQIGEDDRRPLGLDTRQGIDAVAGGIHREPPAPDELLQSDALRRVVFDDEDVIGRGRVARAAHHADLAPF